MAIPFYEIIVGTPLDAYPPSHTPELWYTKTPVSLPEFDSRQARA